MSSSRVSRPKSSRHRGGGLLRHEAGAVDLGRHLGHGHPVVSTGISEMADDRRRLAHAEAARDHDLHGRRRPAAVAGRAVPISPTVHRLSGLDGRGSSEADSKLKLFDKLR
jgi:hypothetical protein